MKEESTFLQIHNDTLVRILAAFIVGGTITSPIINGFSDNPFWIIVGISYAIFMGIGLALAKVQFENKDMRWIWIHHGLFVLLCIYLYFQWGR